MLHLFRVGFRTWAHLRGLRFFDLLYDFLAVKGLSLCDESGTEVRSKDGEIEGEGCDNEEVDGDEGEEGSENGDWEEKSEDGDDERVEEGVEDEDGDEESGSGDEEGEGDEDEEGDGDSGGGDEEEDKDRESGDIDCARSCDDRGSSPGLLPEAWERLPSILWSRDGPTFRSFWPSIGNRTPTLAEGVVDYSLYPKVGDAFEAAIPAPVGKSSGRNGDEQDGDGPYPSWGGGLRERMDKLGGSRGFMAGL